MTAVFQGPRACRAADPPGSGGGGDAPRPPQPQRVLMPPQPARWRVWLWLAVVLALVSPPIFVGLGVTDTTEPRETRALQVGQETWLGQHREGGWQWLVPRRDGRPAVERPPMTAWIHVLTWSRLSPADTPPPVLLMYARIAAGLFALLLVTGVFWAGMSVGGVRVAFMAPLVTATTLLFTQHAQLATRDLHLATFLTLAVGGGLWAMRPLKQTSPTVRQLLGWLACGVALGAAVLTRGFVALPFAVIPLGVMVAIGPHRRFANALGVLFALILAVLLAVPWYAYVIQEAPNLGLDRPLETLFAEASLITAADSGRATALRPTWEPIVLFLLVFPWTMWLIGALIQPWIRGRSERRQQLLLAWSWFIAAVGLLALGGVSAARHLLLALPAAGLLVGQLWAFHINLADGGRGDPGINILRVPHWLMLAVVSVGLTGYLFFQKGVAGWVNARFEAVMLAPDAFPGLPPWGIGLFGLTLVTLAGLGGVMHFRWRPRTAFALTLAWAVLLFTVLGHSAARSSAHQNPDRAFARKVAEAVGAQPLYWLDAAAAGRADTPRPGADLRFYGRLVIPPMDRDGLTGAMAGQSTVHLLAADRETTRQMLSELGFQPLVESQATPTSHRASARGADWVLSRWTADRESGRRGPD